jgi:hypothetical protein
MITKFPVTKLFPQKKITVHCHLPSLPMHQPVAVAWRSTRCSTRCMKTEAARPESMRLFMEHVGGSVERLHELITLMEATEADLFSLTVTPHDESQQLLILSASLQFQGCASSSEIGNLIALVRTDVVAALPMWLRIGFGVCKHARRGTRSCNDWPRELGFCKGCVRALELMALNTYSI